MIFYNNMYCAIFLFFFILAVCFIFRVGDNPTEGNKILITTAVLSLIFVNAFKDFRLLPDISGYVPAFEYIARDDSTFLNAKQYYKMQWGYYALNKFLSIFSSNIHFFMGAMEAIICIPYFVLFKRFSKNVAFSTILYMMSWLQSSFVLRQHSAIAFCIISLLFYLDRKYIFAFLCFFFSVLIHPSAAIFILAFVLCYLKKDKHIIMFMVAVFFASFLGGSFFIDKFSENVPGYDVYAMQVAEQVSSKLTSFLLQLSLVLPLLLLLVKKELYLSDTEQIFVKMEFLSFSIRFGLFFVGNYSDTIERLFMTFTFVVFLLIPLIVKSIQIYWLKMLFFAWYLFVYWWLFAISSHSYISDFKLNFSY